MPIIGPVDRADVIRMLVENSQKKWKLEPGSLVSFFDFRRRSLIER